MCEGERIHTLWSGDDKNNGRGEGKNLIDLVLHDIDLKN